MERKQGGISLGDRKEKKGKERKEGISLRKGNVEKERNGTAKGKKQIRGKKTKRNCSGER